MTREGVDCMGGQARESERESTLARKRERARGRIA